MNLRNNIKNFHPAYFAMVMATGIMSIAFEAAHISGIGKTLYTLNLVFYLILCVFLTARMVLFTQDLITDLRTFRRVLLFLTFVVATNTVGMQLLIFDQAKEIAILLWLIALAGWACCAYFVCLDFIPLLGKPLHESVSGAALLVVVSTVSVPLLGVNLLYVNDIHAAYAYFAIGGFWVLGVMLYLIIIALLVYRLFFMRFDPSDWDAPYWICMGAAAIITLTGSELLMRMPAVSAWENIRHSVLWLTGFAWLMGTLWIPYLLLMDIRKLTRAGVAETTPVWVIAFPWMRLAFGGLYHIYDPPSWSRVFPMGMYTVCTWSLAIVSDFDFLAFIAFHWSWFALVIWSLTLIGMLRSAMDAVIRSLRVD